MMMMHHGPRFVVVLLTELQKHIGFKAASLKHAMQLPSVLSFDVSIVRAVRTRWLYSYTNQSLTSPVLSTCPIIPVVGVGKKGAY